MTRLWYYGLSLIAYAMDRCRRLRSAWFPAEHDASASIAIGSGGFVLLLGSSYGAQITLTPRYACPLPTNISIPMRSLPSGNSYCASLACT
jgi:hypothetical protein